MAVTGPDGAVWEVRRRWMPWQARWRRLDRDAMSDYVPHAILDIAEDAIGGGIGYLVLGVALAFLFAFVLIPLTVLVLEILLLLALLAGGIAMRTFLRRPWLIDVTGPYERTYAVPGWRRSARAGALIEQHLRATGAPPTHDDLAARLA